jgi:hypothetical protein
MKEKPTTRLVLIEKAPFYVSITDDLIEFGDYIVDFDEMSDELFLVKHCDSWEEFKKGCYFANITPNGEDEFCLPKHFYIILGGYLNEFVIPKKKCIKVKS